jgi:hypothetical protein
MHEESPRLAGKTTIFSEHGNTIIILRIILKLKKKPKSIHFQLQNYQFPKIHMLVTMRNISFNVM